MGDKCEFEAKQVGYRFAMKVFRLYVSSSRVECGTFLSEDQIAERSLIIVDFRLSAGVWPTKSRITNNNVVFAAGLFSGK